MKKDSLESRDQRQLRGSWVPLARGVGPIPGALWAFLVVFLLFSPLVVFGAIVGLNDPDITRARAPDWLVYTINVSILLIWPLVIAAIVNGFLISSGRVPFLWGRWSNHGLEFASWMGRYLWRWRRIRCTDDITIRAYTVTRAFDMHVIRVSCMDKALMVRTMGPVGEDVLGNLEQWTKGKELKVEIIDDLVRLSTTTD
jgi:hypothetical protein